MGIPEIKMSSSEIYQREIDRYKKQGDNYTIYYRVGLITLKSLTDNDIDILILQYKITSPIFNSGGIKAKYEIMTHYKMVRRQEKILKIKSKYQKKQNPFKRLFNIWK